MDALLVIKGASDANTTPSIRLKDGSDTREAWISNSAGDLVLNVGGNDNVAHGTLKLFESGILDYIQTDTVLRIDSSGRLLVGTTTEGENSAKNFTIAAAAGNVGMTIRSATTEACSLFFSDATTGAAEYAGYVQYAHGSDQLRLGSAGSIDFRASDTSTSFMHIDSSGNVGIGTASPATTLSIRTPDVTGALSPGIRLYNADIPGGAGAGASIQMGWDDTTACAEIGGFYDGAGAALAFRCPASTERMRINSSGKIILPTGSPGIQFGSSNTDTNITSQTLDDYEEGTFTPGISYASGSGWSVSEATGTYIKIGNQVHCICALVWDEGSGSGGVSITGLPFSIKNDSSVRLGGYCIYLVGMSGLSGSNIFLYNTAAQTTATMYYVDAGTYLTSLTDTNTSSSQTTRFVFTYPT